MEFRFKHSVLGTYELNDVPLVNGYIDTVSDKFDYLDTSICYNNDYFLSEILKKNKKMKVISKIPPQMTSDYEFFLSHHLRCLGRKFIDIMLIHNPRSDWHELAVKMEEDKRIKSTGVSNFSIEQLEEYKSVIGKYPEFNEMEINPEYYDKDLIDFCHDKSIKLIAYAILGGKYNARRNIATYTLPYLLSFAAYNAEYVILRSDNYVRLYEMDRFLHSLDHVDITSEVLDLSSKTNKSILPTQYKSPKYYTRKIYPTNSDKVVILKNDRGANTAICTGFYKPDNMDDLDVLKLGSDVDHPWEFISDFRAYFRYKVDELAHKLTGEWPVGYYSFPSTYIAKVASSKWKLTDRKTKCFLVSVNLLTEDGHLSKVNDGKSEFIIESDYKEV